MQMTRHKLIKLKTLLYRDISSAFYGNRVVANNAAGDWDFTRNTDAGLMHSPS